MKENTHVIWSDINLNLDDWRNDLKQTYPNADDNFLYKAMYENNASYLYDERINLDIQLPREIIVIADLGLWNGRRSGYKVIESGNIRDCLYSDCDFNEWYVDNKGDFRCKAIHHDGTNYYLYGRSKQVRYIMGLPLCPIGYIKTRNAHHQKGTVCKYTEKGRQEIHQNLKFSDDVITVMHMLSKTTIYNRSIEYMDNRISVYAAQYGRCAVTGKVLWIDDIHCHHKIPKKQGGTDEYKNLVILHKDVHTLVHAVKRETIDTYISLIKPDNEMLKKINVLRKLCGNIEIK